MSATRDPIASASSRTADHDGGEHAQARAPAQARQAPLASSGVVIDVRQQQHLHGADDDIDRLARILAARRAPSSHPIAASPSAAAPDRMATASSRRRNSLAAPTDGTSTHLGVGASHSRSPALPREADD